MPVRWTRELPEADPIFSGTHFTFYAGLLLSTEELKAAHRVTAAEEDQVEFVSPNVPGRMQRQPSTPPADESA